jgi:hypothetical protein
MPFSPEGRPGEADEARPREERRKEEARQRAEAEAAALEQLKEENPEAYAKPSREEGEEARRSRGRRAEDAARPSEADQTNSRRREG